MAGTVYALLVGINDYKPPINALYGCRNDVEALAAFLGGRLGDRLHPVVLLDGEATRDRIVEAFTDHLGQAGVGDVALFAYSGHGTEEPAPPEYAEQEPTGRIQVLLSADAGRRVGTKLVRGLADKELAVLLEQVAAGGAHVAVLLDCCHSGNGTRDVESRVRQWRPSLDALDGENRATAEALVATPRPLEEFLPGTWAGRPSGTRGVMVESGSPTHVALSACESFEVAKEQPLDGVVRGVFSVALLDALERLGAGATYRSVLTAARSGVERSTSEQTPTLYPTDSAGLADTVVLDGSLTASAPTFRVTQGADGWTVDAGALHGLRDPVGEEAYVLACTAPDGTRAGSVRVVAVEAGRSRVEPLGWEPTAPVYDATVEVVPVPPARVSLEGDAAAAALVAGALADRGPASPVRLAEPGTAPGGLHLRVAAWPDGYTVERLDGSTGATVASRVDGPWLRVLRADGTPVTDDIAGVDAGSARAAVQVLEHVATWDQLLHLGDHPSSLGDAVALELSPAEAGETSRPEHRPVLEPDAHGAYHLGYRGSRPEDHPAIFVRLRNTTADRDVYVSVIAFSDRYGCGVLYPAQRLDAGQAVQVWADRPSAAIPVRLPEGRPVVPGATGRDWLKLVVSDTPFDDSTFALGNLREVVERSAGGVPPGRPAGRLASRPATRTIGGDEEPPPARAEWLAVTFPVVTTVPTGEVQL